MEKQSLPDDLQPVYDKVEAYFHGRAKKSLMRFRKHLKTFGGTNDVYTFDLWLISRDKEEPNKIRGNDPFTFHLYIEDLGEGKYSVSLMSQSLNFSIQPEKEFLAMSHRKVPFRKTKGDAKKVETTLLRYIGKYLDSYVNEEEKGNLYHQEYVDSYPVK